MRQDGIKTQDRNPNGWDKIAKIRRRQIESGIDITFSKIFVPYYIDLVTKYRPKRLLEIGCGTGHLSASLSRYVSTIVALEPSVSMYEEAKQVLQDTTVKILNLKVQDYTSQEPFDLIISHMCLQVVDNIDEFLVAINALMSKESLFVYAIPHPCFYNAYKHFFGQDEYSYMRESRKLVSFAISKDPDTPISGVPYSHRPLSRYFRGLKGQNLTVKDFHEVFPSPEIQLLYDDLWDSPRYCIFHVIKN
jgi:trans-aconitate methyltransferase